MDTNEKIKIVGTNIQEKANLIWNVANSLFGAYKPHEYGLVILPMVVIKRFHDCLLPTREKVLATYEKVKQLAVKDGFLRIPRHFLYHRQRNSLSHEIADECMPKAVAGTVGNFQLPAD